MGGKKRSPRPPFISQVDRIESAKARATRYAADGRVEEAIELLSFELGKNPLRTDLLLTIAKILIQAEMLPEAVDTLTVLKAHMPVNAEVAKLLGAVLGQMNENERAIAELNLANRLAPNDPQIALNLGKALAKKGNFEEAANWIGVAIDHAPDDIELRCYAAGVLNQAGRPEECRRVLLENPEIAKRPEARLVGAMLMPLVAASSEEIAAVRNHFRKTLLTLREAGQKIERPDKTILATNFGLGYHGEEDRELLQLWAEVTAELCPSLSYVSASLSRAPLDGRKIKVGFVSSNLRNHSVGRVLNRFLKELDRKRFEVVLFEIPGKLASGQKESRGYADRTVFLPEPIEVCRQAIERELIDVLVFPDFVLEPKEDHLAFSRLAPVQCSTWGHPGTSGRPSIDYWISCRDWEPEGNERLYTERLVRLSTPPMIAEEEPLPEVLTSRRELGIPEGRLYGCPQSLSKIHPNFDPVLAEILERDPEGSVILAAGSLKGWVERFKARFNSRFPDVAERLVILDQMRFKDYMSLLQHLSVSLDPFEFGGGLSALDAFTVGLPMVTCPGGQQRNRMTFSFYRMMGFTDLVADSPRAYVDLALKVAMDEEYRAAVSKEILARKSLVFETVGITRELEVFFEKAVGDALNV